MTIDAEVRALERVARARPDDGAAQLGLGSALERVGRRREAVEAFLRAAAQEPGDAAVQRALDLVPSWSGPRGPGGTRAVAVDALRDAPAWAFVKRVGQAAHGSAGLAVGRGAILVRISDAPGEWRLSAHALVTGRELWSREEQAVAAAPPLVAGDSVLDATLELEPRETLLLRVRARELATGRERWCTREELPSEVTPPAAFDGAAATAERLALGIRGHSKVSFEPLLRVLDVATGEPVERARVAGLNDLALAGTRAFLSTKFDSLRHVERRESREGPGWLAARFERTERIAVQGERVVAATETSLLVLERETGAERIRQPRRFAGHPDGLVVAPRVLVASWQRERTVALDVETGDRLWQDDPIARILAAAEETLYAADGAQIRALDLTQGTSLWSLDLGAGPLGIRAGGGVQRLAAAPSRVVGLTRDGTLFVLAPREA